MSVVTITYTTPKDFVVDIDSIESISPRGLELAFAAVEKKFARMKGENIAGLKLRVKEAEKDRARAEKDEATMKALIAEETARYRSAASKAAEKRFNELEPEAQAKLSALLEEEGELKVKKDFLHAIAVKIEVRTNDPDFDQDTDPEDLANEVLDEVESIEDEIALMDSDITDAEDTLSELESEDSEQPELPEDTGAIPSKEDSETE